MVCQFGAWCNGILAALAAVCTWSCAVGPEDNVALVVEWSERPSDDSYRYVYTSRGRSTLTTTWTTVHWPIEGDPHEIPLDPRQKSELAQILTELVWLPRAAYMSRTYRGIEVRVTLTRSGETVRYIGLNDHRAAIGRLATLLSREIEGEDAEALRVLAATVRYRGAEGWTFPGDGDPTARLAEILDPPTPNPELRALGARLAVEHRCYELTEPLRGHFLASFDRDPNGDFYLALALLQLGVPIGLETVLRVAEMPTPDYSIQAIDAINRLFSSAYGGRVFPPYDFRSESDPRPKAAREFLQWFVRNRDAVRFSKEHREYEWG